METELKLRFVALMIWKTFWPILAASTDHARLAYYNSNDQSLSDTADRL